MNADKNFEGANQDFEFIRSPSKPVTKLKRGPGNPIAELESIGKRNVDKKSDEDDPPFNFQGMLRKTNFQRSSLKRNVEEPIQELPYSKVLKNKVNKQNVNEVEKAISEKSLSFEVPEKEMNGITCIELAPGIILEGRETEL